MFNNALRSLLTSGSWGQPTLAQRIVRAKALYDVLLHTQPSPVIELNRAVAIAMRDGPLAGLVLIDAILAHGDLSDYHLAHSARGELCKRLGKVEEARSSLKTSPQSGSAGTRTSTSRAPATRAVSLNLRNILLPEQFIHFHLLQ